MGYLDWPVNPGDAQGTFVKSSPLPEHFLCLCCLGLTSELVGTPIYLLGGPQTDWDFFRFCLDLFFLDLISNSYVNH